MMEAVKSRKRGLVVFKAVIDSRDLGCRSVISLVVGSVGQGGHD